MNTIDKIREGVNNLDFETGFDPDEKLSSEDRAEGIAEERRVTRELAENQHLAYRATAAYFTEHANTADSLVMDAMGEVIEHKTHHGDLIMVNSNASVGVSIEAGPDRATVRRNDRKMPIITLFEEFSEGQKTIRQVMAKYRYNPKADKLQRIG